MYTKEYLRKLGLNGTYLGFHYLSEAINLVSQNKTLLLALNTQLYPIIARKYLTSSENVERNIRTAISICWSKGDRELLNNLFPKPLNHKPSAGEFIDALYTLTNNCKQD